MSRTIPTLRTSLIHLTILHAIRECDRELCWEMVAPYRVRMLTRIGSTADKGFRACAAIRKKWRSAPLFAVLCFRIENTAKGYPKTPPIFSKSRVYAVVSDSYYKRGKYKHLFNAYGVENGGVYRGRHGRSSRRGLPIYVPFVSGRHMNFTYLYVTKFVDLRMRPGSSSILLFLTKRRKR